MRRILLPCSAALAACTPSSQDVAMRTPEPTTGPIAAVSREMPDGPANAAAAQEPIPEPVSAAAHLTPVSTTVPDMDAAARGRLILSTAFVRIGPDGLLTVELRNGQTLLLRDVAVNAKDYCGIRVAGDPSGDRYCGRYIDVAAARPGGGAAPATVDPVGSARAPVGRN